MNSSKLNSTLSNLLEKYLSDGDAKEARLLLGDPRFKTCVQEDCSEVLNLLMPFLSKEELSSRPELYNTVEYMVKVAAEWANPQDIIFELLDRLETVESDNVLISLLKAVQVALLKQPEKKSLSMEWCLKPVLRYIRALPQAKELKTSFSVQKCAFYESDEKIARVLELHLTLLLFLEPLVKKVVAERSNDHTTRTLETTRQNVLIHFLLNLIETDLNRIYVPFDRKSETNTYIKQCRETITNFLTSLLGSDPYYLLAFIERRIRFPIEVDENTTDLKKMNVFILPNKCEILAHGHYFHTLLVHGLFPDDAPKVYSKEFAFLKSIYLITEMIRSEDENVQMKGIELGSKVLDSTKEPNHLLSDEYLELNIFEGFFDRMIQLMVYSENENIRKNAVKYSESLIVSFNHRGRLIILENLFREYSENTGLCGYLSILYKNMIMEVLNGEVELPPEYTSTVFRKILLKYICTMPTGEKTDIIEWSDRIVSALNFIRFLVLRDRKNRTTFWDLKKDIEEAFLDKLRMAIDLSRAHYSQYKKNIEQGIDEVPQEDVSLSIAGQSMPELTKEQKLVAMNNCLNKIDLMDSLLARVNECIADRILHPKQLGSLQCPTYRLLSTSNIPTFSSSSSFLSTSHSRRLSSKTTKDASTIEDFRSKQEKLEEEFYKNTPVIQPNEIADEKSLQSEEPVEDEHTSKIRRDILEAALTFVPTLGWSKEAICKGAEQLGYPSVVHGMFPRGSVELVEHFYSDCTEKLIAWMEKETEGADGKVANPKEFVIKAVQQRLRMVEPYLINWPQAIAIMSLPQNAMRSLANLLTLVDDICYYSGDRAVDFGWYTRRVGLAGIFKVTELYLLQDKSPDHQATWTFLERRMEDAVILNNMLEQSDEVTQNMQKAVGSVFTTARNILGLNFQRR